MWVALLLSFIASLADIIGGSLTVFRQLGDRGFRFVTSLGTGFLLGATLLDRMPESLHQLPNMAPIYILIGYLLLLLLDNQSTHQSHWLGDAASTDDKLIRPALLTEVTEAPAPSHAVSQNAALASFISLLVHTFMDGVVIAGSFEISRAAGVLIFFAILIHKIPEGLTMAAISLSAGASRLKAFLTSAALSLSTLVGASIILLIGNVDTVITGVLMALATGAFLFITTTDLMPNVRSQRWSAVSIVVLGAALFYVSLTLVKHFGLG